MSPEYSCTEGLFLDAAMFRGGTLRGLNHEGSKFINEMIIDGFIAEWTTRRWGLERK
jgi:hypothetical protein